ncbi:MAG: hypothetical protein AAFX65_04985 [Cyanobacteria bacterium J06638_7]
MALRAPTRSSCSRPAAVVTAPLLAALALALSLAAPARAQRQTFTLGPGSSVGPNTQVVPTNCVTAADGTITCNTELRNPPGRTPARPSLELFEN